MTIAELLRLDRSGGDRFVGRSEAPPPRPDIFGGQVAGQALQAAIHTAPDGHLPNSAHCYFLRRGNPLEPLHIAVDRVRDGRTYSTRRVEVVQGGRPIFAMLASFHRPEPGVVYDVAMPAGVPAPEELPVPAPEERAWHHGLDVRVVPAEGLYLQWWGRIPGPFPSDAGSHLAGLLYASDYRAGGVAMRAVGIEDSFPTLGRPVRPPVNVGSLDHAIWFHRVPTVDEWFLIDVRPRPAGDGRGLVVGSIFDRSGAPLASFAQEMFMKPFDE